MNNIDRFLRVIYTEADIGRLMTRNPFQERSGSSNSTAHFWLGGIEDLGGGSCGGSSAWSVPAGESVERFRQWVIEVYLRLYPRNYSKDEVELLLQKQLLDCGAMVGYVPVNALTLLMYAAGSLLRIKGGELVVRPGTLMEWNGLSNKIDQNVLFAAFDVVQGREDNEVAHVLVRYDDERLRDILNKGCSDNHAHLKGSGYSCEINWYCYLHLSVHRPGTCAIILDEMLGQRWGHLDTETFELVRLAYLKLPYLRALLAVYASVALKEEKAGPRVGLPERLNLQKLNEMIGSLLSASDEVALRLVCSTADFCDVVSVGLNDVQKPVMDKVEDYWLFEQVFQRSVFRILRESSDQFCHPVATYAFNVYIAACTQFKLCLIHDNATMGFTRFSASERLKESFIDAVPGSEDMLYQSVFDRYYRTGGVRFAELRIAPKEPGAMVRLKDKLDKANEKTYRRYREQNGNARQIEYRLAVHFIKGGEGVNVAQGCSRKGAQQAKNHREMNALESLFSFSEWSKEYPVSIAGIDAANFEMHTRPEVFGPLYRRFRENIASGYQIGCTYHVGEDFVTLCNGLRAIDESIEHLELSEGDRLGHATALGIDVGTYFQAKRSYVTSSLGEYVDDVAWMWRIISERKSDHVDVILYLAHEFDTRIRELFGSLMQERAGQMEALAPPLLEDYLQAYDLRGDDPELYRDFCDVPAVDEQWQVRRLPRSSCARSNARARALCNSYQFDECYKKSELAAVAVGADPRYLKAVRLAQEALREKVAAGGITIEANPTSNRKISSVKHYIEVPLLRLNRRGLSSMAQENDASLPDVPTTINTDDSGVFQTDLAMEYALIVEALKLEECDHEEIYSYIDYIRELSMTQRMCFR